METAISLDKKERGTGHPDQQPDSPRHGPLTTDPSVALKEENILTSASGVQKPERFDLYVGKLRSICEMHGIPTGSYDHLSGFLNRLGDDRRLGMDFWALIGKLSSRDGGELNDGQILAVVVAGITGRMPDENDDRLRPQINHLQALLSGVDIQRPEPPRPDFQRPDPQTPARAVAAVPIDHRRRRFSITPEDVPPALETQMLETVQRLELISRQLKESLTNIDQRINQLEVRLGEHPANLVFGEDPAPVNRVAPVANRRNDESHPPPGMHLPPVEQATPFREEQNFSPVEATPSIEEQYLRAAAEATPSTQHFIPEPIHQPNLPPAEQSTPSFSDLVPEPIQNPIPEPIREPIHEPVLPEPSFAPAEQATQAAPSIDEPILPVAAQSISPIEEPTLHTALPPTAVEEELILRPASVQTPELPPIRKTQVQETPVPKTPVPKTQVPETQVEKPPVPRTQASRPGSTSKQRLVLEPIAPPSESSSARQISKTHTRPLFAGYDSAPAPGGSGKKLASAAAIVLLLAGSGYAWYRYSTQIEQLIHPNGTTSSTTQSSAQPTDATPEDSASQTAQPQTGQTQTEQPQPAQSQTDQPTGDQPTSSATTPQPEPSPHKPAPDRPPTKAAAAAEDLFSNSNWSAIKVPSEVMQKNLIVSRVPTYPDAAKASRVQGSVIAQALIQKDGSIARVRVLQGDSRLRSAAIDAIFRQKYRPYSVNGTPVDVITTVTLEFTPPQ